MAINYKEEPRVLVQSSSESTVSSTPGGSKDLVVVAVLVTELGPDGVTTYNDRTTFLNDFTTSGVLSSDLHSSYHHIYDLLSDVTVKVIKAGTSAAGSSVGTNTGLSLLDIFGADRKYKYSGLLGLNDRGESVLVNDRIVANDSEGALLTNLVFIYDGYFTTNLGVLSIQDTKFSNIINENNKYEGIEAYSWKYNSSSELEVTWLVVTEAGVTDFDPEVSYTEFKTNILLELTDITDISEVGILPTLSSYSNNLVNNTDYNLLLVDGNPLGLSIDNYYISPIRFEVTTNNGSGGLFLTTHLGAESIVVTDSTKSIVYAVGSELDGKLFYNKVTATPVNTSTLLGSFAITFDKTNVDTTIFSTSIPSNTGDVDINILTSSLLSILELDNGDRIDFVFDSGIHNAFYHSTVNSVASNLKALGCLSLDYSKFSTLQEAYTFIGSSPILNSSSIRHSPYRVTSYGTYSVAISPAVDYIKAIARNKRNRSEFAPAHGINNGFIGTANWTNIFTKSQRQGLLGTQVNAVKVDSFRGVTYFTDNTTTIPNSELFNEEQIRRLANRMDWDIDFILEQFIAELDIELTAERVKDTIMNYANRTILTQRYAPTKVEALVKESSNVLGDGELEVEVNVYIGRSLKKINVFNKFLPLSSLE